MTAAFAVLTLAACEDDPTGSDLPPPPVFKNLTQRGDVLHNLQLSYNRRNLQKYDELLDNDFTFHLSAGDVGGGIPSQWDRSVEVAVHTNLFDPTYNGTTPACESIEFDIDFEDGVSWTEFDSPTIPSEKWYSTTVSYHFVFEMEGDIHRINNPGSAAEFTVRNAGTEDAPQWRLVEVSDLGSDLLVFSSAAATEQATWGGVKAMYLE